MARSQLASPLHEGDMSFRAATIPENLLVPKAFATSLAPIDQAL
jgi:hypothetical protein